MKVFAMLSYLALAVNAAENGSKGPTKFSDGKNIYLEVKPAVTVNVFEKLPNGKRVDDILLNGTATLVVDFNSKEDILINLEWKNVAFKGKKGKETLNALAFQLAFTRKRNEYKLTGAKVESAALNGETPLANNQLQAKTADGDVVSAPVGQSICSPAMVLKPTKATLNATTAGAFAVGLTFPGMRLQVFDVKQKIGPCVDLGLGIPIGFWMGLIVSLIFALVCYYGFSMLASITTNDRWDDPKGMPIQVPQHD